MACPPALPSVTGAKGPRMCRAVVDLGGDMMRDILYHHVKPAVVMSYVLACRFYRNHPLNTHQISILGNAGVRGDYSEFDITLIYSLIRNLTPTSTAIHPTVGWGRPVSAGDTALGDDIERIRDLRNTMYGHVASTSLPDSTYNFYMQELYDICNRMDTVHAGSLASPSPRPQTYCQTLGDIQTCCMDLDMEARYMEEIRRVKQTDQDTRDLIEVVRKDAAGNFLFSLFWMYKMNFTLCVLLVCHANSLHNARYNNGSVRTSHNARYIQSVYTKGDFFIYLNCFYVFGLFFFLNRSL